MIDESSDSIAQLKSHLAKTGGHCPSKGGDLENHVMEGSMNHMIWGVRFPHPKSQRLW